MPSHQTTAAPMMLADVLFEKSDVGLCLVGPDGRILRANAAWLLSAGLTTEQAIGEDVVEVFAGARGIAPELLARARAGHRVELAGHAVTVGGRESGWDGSVEPVPMEEGTGLLITSRPVRPDFQRLYETAPSGLLVLAPDRPRFTIVAASDAYLRATRTTRDIIGRGIFEVFPDDPEDPASTGGPARASFERVLATGAPDTMPVQKHSLRRPSAEGGGFEERYWSPVNTPVAGDDGTVLYIQHRVEDVTEFVRQKQARVEQEAIADALRTRAGEMEADVLRRARELQEANLRLREAYEQLADVDRGKEAQLRQLYDSGMIGVVHFELDGRISEANARFLAMVSYTREDIAAGRVAWDRMTPPEHRAADENAMSELKRSGVVTPYAKELLRKDGTPVAVIVGAATYDDQRHRGIAFVLDITDRKRAEDALRESDRRFRSVVENMSEGLMLFDASGNLTYQNPASLQIHGFEPLADGRIAHEALAATWQAWDETGRAIGFDEWPVSRVFRDERFQNQVLRVRRVETGQEFCASYNGSPIHDDQGHIVLGFITIRDITRRLNAQAERDRVGAALRESERRLRATFEEASVGIVEVDADDRFVAVNARFCEMLGYERDELLARTIHDVTAPEDAAVTRYLNARGQAGELRVFDYETRYVRRDGTRLWAHVNVSVVLDDAGGFLRAIGTAEDITDRKRAQDSLRESEARFRSVFEQAAVGMGRVSFTDARWIDVNDAFCRMLGRTREEMLRTRWPEMTHPDDVELDLEPFRRMAAGDLETYTVEKRFIHCDGHHVWAKLTLSLVRDRNGDPDYEVAIIEDVSDRKRAEAALREANDRLREADRRKDEFLGMLSHELRNPLAPIRNSTYILRNAQQGSERALRAQAVIERQAEHLTRLVDDLLDITRIARGKIELRCERVDLCDVVRRAAEDFRPMLEERGVAFDVAVPSSPVPASADATRLAQVVGNLLHNASKFTRSGDAVALSLTRVPGCIEIAVRDTGAGIDPELLPSIFEAFTQGERTLARSEGGLGLGLALVKGITELHGGTVRAGSDGMGRGAEFVVRLPLGERVRSRAGATAGVGPEHRRRRRVLVVDDNTDAAESLADVVSMLGHGVDVAYDGSSAIAKARANAPDVVLCDIGLPGAMSGYDVATALREAGSSARLFAVSGYAQPEDVRKAIEAGFDGHIAKPPRIEDIERLLA